MSRRDNYPFEASERGLVQQVSLLLLGNKHIKLDTQHFFHPKRKWRFDGAIPALKIAFEYQGGIFVQGGHQRVSGIRNDWEKFNEAQLVGWQVFLFGPDETRTGNAAVMIERAIIARAAKEGYFYAQPRTVRT